MPDPIPSKAVWLPDEMNSQRAAIANVNGRATEPVLPSQEKVA